MFILLSVLHYLPLNAKPIFCRFAKFISQFILTVFLRKFILWYSATFFWASLQLLFISHHSPSFQIAKTFQFVFDIYTMLILSHCKVFWYTTCEVSPTQNVGLKYYLIRKLRLLKIVQSRNECRYMLLYNANERISRVKLLHWLRSEGNLGVELVHCLSLTLLRPIQHPFLVQLSLQRNIHYNYSTFDLEFYNQLEYARIPDEHETLCVNNFL